MLRFYKHCESRWCCLSLPCVKWGIHTVFHFRRLKDTVIHLCLVWYVNRQKFKTFLIRVPPPPHSCFYLKNDVAIKVSIYTFLSLLAQNNRKCYLMIWQLRQANRVTVLCPLVDGWHQGNVPSQEASHHSVMQLLRNLKPGKQTG